MKAFLLTVLFGLASASFYNVILPEEFSGLCENENHRVFEIEGKCDRYILCLFHKEMIVLCRPNEVFDRYKEECVVGECNQITTTPSTTTTTTIADTTTTTTYTEPDTTTTTTSTEPDTTTTTTTTEPDTTTTTSTEPDTTTTTTSTEPDTTTTTTTEPDTTTTTTTEPDTTTTTTSQPGTTEDWSNKCEGNAFGNFAIEGTCKDYVFCFIGQPPLLFTCAPGSIFLAGNNSCVPGDQQTCIASRTF